jgi:hypothetical protein
LSESRPSSPDLDAVLGVSRPKRETAADPAGAAESPPSTTGGGDGSADVRSRGADPQPSDAEHPSQEAGPELSSELDLAAGEADDDVHFGLAAKALAVSRKTVERMVKREQLDRGPSGLAATVSKRSLVAVLEQRRRGGVRPRAGTDVTPGRPGFGTLGAPWSVDASAELQELLRPVLEPLLEDFVAARARAAVLESQLEDISARVAQQRARDELLLSLATGGWLERRRARRMALRGYVLRDDL